MGREIRLGKIRKGRDPEENSLGLGVWKPR